MHEFWTPLSPWSLKSMSLHRCWMCRRKGPCYEGGFY